MIMISGVTPKQNRALARAILYSCLAALRTFFIYLLATLATSYVSAAFGRAKAYNVRVANPSHSLIAYVCFSFSAHMFVCYTYVVSLCAAECLCARRKLRSRTRSERS